MLMKNKGIYRKIKVKNAIEKLIEDKQIIITPGGYFGDEAKGKTVAGIGEDPRVSTFARVNSGENAGHTIYFNGEKFVFNLLPSGVFTGKKIIVGDNTVMDPLSFFIKEISPLLERNISTKNIFIGNTSLVFPWHKISDALRNPNASTGKGMSQVHADISRKRDVNLEALINQKYDLFEKNLELWWDEISPKLSDDVANKLIENNNFPFDVANFLKAKNNKDRIDLLVKMYDDKVRDFLVEHYADTNQIMLDELKKGNKIILEAPQSFYLSNSVGTHHSSSTSAQTHSSGIFAASNLPSEYMDKILTINVHKAPGSSRVGSGANPSGHVEQEWFNRRGLKKEMLKYDIDLNSALKQFVASIDTKTGLQDSSTLYVDSNGENFVLDNVSSEWKKPLTVNEALAISEVNTYGEFGSTTGKPRITGALDLPHLKNLRKYQGDKLSISCLDRADGLEHLLLVTGYIYEGDKYNYKGKIYNDGDKITVNDSLPGEEILKNCRAIYEVVPGWKKAESLETNVQKYLSRIEDLTGMNIISIGIGPKTDEILYLEK